MPSYLFHCKGAATLARYVAPDTLFAFDLDGSLAPTVEEYGGAAQVPKAVRATLLRLVGLAKVAVITGRSWKDAVALLGFEPHLVIGSHAPARASDKGDALAAAMESLGSTRAVYFGDDDTEEEVFKLKGEEVFGVQIGNDSKTAAPNYQNRQSELLGLLRSIIGILESKTY